MSWTSAMDRLASLHLAIRWHSISFRYWYISCEYSVTGRMSSLGGRLACPLLMSRNTELTLLASEQDTMLLFSSSVSLSDSTVMGANGWRLSRITCDVLLMERLDNEFS